MVQLRSRRPGDLPVGIDTPDVVTPPNKNLAIDVSYGVEVDDIAKGINDVVALSDRHGGQIYERKINITDDRSSTASFVIKLPPANVEAAIADLDAIGVRRTAIAGHRGRHQSGRRHRCEIGDRPGQPRPGPQAVGGSDRPRPDPEPREPTDRARDARRAVHRDEASAQRSRVAGDAASAAERSARYRSPRPSSSRRTPEKPTIGRAFKTGWNGFITVLAAIMIFIGYTAPFLVLALIAAAVPDTDQSPASHLQAAPRSRSAAPPPPPVPVADPQTSERDSVGAARNP